MALSPGIRFGPNEILAKLGHGGMGEVYRARDTRLKRDVAIKVLPDGFARDPDRLSRFEREAALLATLNHPNVAAIYGFEEAASVNGIVLELVEGPTLGLAEREEQILNGDRRSYAYSRTSHTPASGSWCRRREARRRSGIRTAGRSSIASTTR